MVNLFDSSSSSSEEEGSVGTRESRDSFISQDIDSIQDEPDDTINLSYDETDAIIDAEEERNKLRITSSLMDDEDSSDSDIDNEVTTSLPAAQKDIFRSPHNAPPTDKPSYVSLTSWNTINLLDEASQSQADTEVIHKTYSYSDKFNSVYEEAATAAVAKPKAVTKSNDNRNRFQNARSSFSTAIKTFGGGLTGATACDVGTTFPMVASSWDVDVDEPRISEKRFSVGSHNNNNKRRRMPLDIRSELVLMQDKMDQYELTIQSLRRDNSAMSTAKLNFQSMLGQSDKSLQTAQLESKVSKNRADSLTLQLNEMKRELQRAKRDVLLVKKESDEAFKSEQTRIATLENELQREQDKHKLEIASLNWQISSAEQNVEECQEVIEKQAVKIVNLEVTLAETTNAATDALEVAKEAEEERDLWKSRAMLSPKAKSLAKSFAHTHTSSYYSCEQQRKLTPKRSVGKENNDASGCCTLCFKSKKQNGITRWCKCGKEVCNKWAHAQCLAKGQSNNISTSVSHPGTPPPPLPLILCRGIESVIRK